MAHSRATTKGPVPEQADLEQVNEVRLVGRVAATPVVVELPSGDRIATVRVVVRRPDASVRGNARVDALECTAWNGRVRRSVTSWAEGDVVEVSGAIRRRFFRAGTGLASRVEIELAKGRLIRRAGSG